MINYKSISPQILYFGTPVALITTVNEHGEPNIGPISSVWALGHTLLSGLETGSKTCQNLIAQKECVINIAHADLIEDDPVKIHVDEALIVRDNHIDPAQWNPLIYNFRHYSGLGRELGKTFKAEV